MRYYGAPAGSMDVGSRMSPGHCRGEYWGRFGLIGPCQQDAAGPLGACEAFKWQSLRDSKDVGGRISSGHCRRNGEHWVHFGPMRSCWQVTMGPHDARLFTSSRACQIWEVEYRKRSPFATGCSHIDAAYGPKVHNVAQAPRDNAV